MACQCSLKSRQSDSHTQLNRYILKAFIGETEDVRTKAAVSRQLCYEQQLSCTSLIQIGRFNVFDEGHMTIVHESARSLSKLPLPDMIDTLCCWRKMPALDPALMDYLTRIALWKHTESKHLALPPAYQTLPSKYFDTATLPHSCGELDSKDWRYSVLDPEFKLAWWREDPGLALHHHNWHVYYPYTEPVRDRQGELFAYMHEQMLARYDFERLAVGFERVCAYGPGWCWEKPLKEGYNPRMPGLSFRPSEMNIPEAFRKDGRLILTDTLHRSKERLFYSIARGYFENSDGNKENITINKLGSTVEANMGSVNKLLYGNLHNNGHCAIAAMNDPDGRFGVDAGPMLFTETAPRDPVFFRWHKFCDALFEAHRVTIRPYTVQDLCMGGVEIQSFGVESRNQLVETALEIRGNSFYTFMESRMFSVYLPQKSEVKKTVLNHLPFQYKIKVRNSNIDTPMTVVFRVFLAPQSTEPLEEWRNMFVELDKFVETIEGGSEVEIVRDDADSSVILPPETTIEDILAGKGPSRSRCGCGWPLNLLIPRGTPCGMEATLFVLATDWSDDAVNPMEVLPGSVSYCGKVNDFYPDKRSMGFPFDRITNFPDIDYITRAVPNSCAISVKIFHVNDYHDSHLAAHKVEVEESASFVFVN